MKDNWGWKPVVVLLVFMAMGSAGYGQSTTQPNIETLTILSTNDLHAHLLPDSAGRGGFANVAGYIRGGRRSRERVLVLNGGDMVQGTPVSTLYSGTPICEILNACGYDAAVFGNHDFDYGLAMVNEYRKIATYPLLSAKVLLNGRLVADEAVQVFDLKGLKVGVLGLTTREYISGVTILASEAAVKRYVPELRRQCDLVVALTHLGVEEDKQLAKTTHGIDVIVGGHSHTELEKPIQVEGTVIVQAGLYGRWVGELNLQVDRKAKKVVAYDGRLVAIPAAKVAPDPAVQKLVDRWEGKVSDLVDIRIGVNPVFMDKLQVVAAMERSWRETYKADFTFENEGSTRDSLPAGDILIRHIYNIFPFNNTLVILDLTREQVCQVLPDAKFAETKGFYTLITNSYAGGELIAKFHLPETRVHRIKTTVREAMIDDIRRHGTLRPVSSQPAEKKGVVLPVGH